MTQSWTIATFVSLLVFLAGGLATFWRVTGKLSDRIARLESDNETFWRVLGPPLAGIIHSPVHVRRDELMDREFVKGEKLSVDELSELACMLRAESIEGSTEWKRAIAQLFLMRVLREIEQRGKRGNRWSLRSMSS